MIKKLLILLVFLGVVILFFPKIVSSSIGKTLLIRAIEKKRECNLQVEELSLTWLGPQEIQGVYYQDSDIILSFDFLRADLRLWDLFSLLQKDYAKFFSLGSHFHLSNANAEFLDQNNPATLKNFQLKITKNTSKESLTKIDAKGELFAKVDQKHGLIYINALTMPPLTKDLKILSAEANFEFRDVPTTIWDYLFSSKNQLLSAYLGKSSLIKGQFNLTKGVGPLYLEVDSPHMSGSLSGNLQQGILALTKPLMMSFTLTEEISDQLLRHTSPFFVTAVSSKNPITLTIEPEGAYFPLIPFDKSNIKIKNAKLNAGKLTCKNGSSLSLIISLLKLKSFSKVPEMEIWFTPLFFSVDQGILNADRMDMLVANEFHLLSWGRLDILTKNLDMTLGISASALQKSFGLRGLLPNYVLQIPLKGTLDDPDIDMGKAAGNIAALFAGSVIKGPFGEILQTIPQVQEKPVPSLKEPPPWK